MFKSWRSEKKKIKMVFKLQFQATQVPRLKKPALFVSLMPDDVGKPTFKLEKTAVQEGTCTWEKPVYVNVKLVKEMKTGKLHEKIYHFIVSSGSSKSGYLGEASIDFADFAEEAEPMTVSLPLKFANSGVVLNVTIQKMQGGIDQRYIEENGESEVSNDVSLKTQMQNEDADRNGESFAEDRSLENEEEGSFKSNAGSNAITPKNRLHRRSSTEWSLGSASDGSLFDSINSLEDNLPRESQDAPSDTVEKLKTEVSNLMRQADLSELEMQSLRKQIMKENRRAQDLSTEMADLKVEKDALKVECEKLQSSQKSAGGEELLKQLLAENKDLRVKVEEIRRELGHEKDVKTNLQLQLQKTQDSNAELIHAVQDLDELLGQKNVEVSRLSSKLELRNDGQELEKRCKCNAKDNEEQLPISEPEKVDGEENDRSELHQLEQKITDLCDEIEMYREDREKLESYIERLTQDYDDLKQENHVISSELEQNQVEELRRQNECSESAAKITELESQLQWLEGKFKKQTQELSESVISINELDCQVKGLEKELEKQAQVFENELEAVTNAKIEQEQRAIHAEEALRKTRWNYASTAERLQEEFKRLSVEMAGKFEENEKLTAKAMAETEELRLQNKILEDKLQEAAEELVLIKDQNKIKVEEVSTHLDFKTKHVEQMSVELEGVSNQLRDVKKREEEKQEAFSVEIQMLKTKIEKLNKEGNVVPEHSKQDDELRDQLEQMRISLAETRNLLESSKKDRDELQRNCELAKKEAGKTQEELCTLRSSKEEKENTIKELISEMEMLRTQHEDLRHCLSNEELQKETLQKQILQLKDELHKVQDVRKLEERKIIQDLPHSKRSTTKNKLARKEDNTAILERNESDLAELLKEMALLKERNKSMETELKEMEERYSEISLKFATVEGERQELVMTIRNLRNGKKN
ncbi:hypothetical protein K2173_026693 [Erythroxylum novogranatense]|uniref:C2 NT-type domain-containing protein n=1 Tax=Erythroxylum novogranatense TaxID=1862640 RepID=A0AAV8TWZ5_9ROSI|nr:hypothetical protein K2173_026693 [Erythroxylum novogranatense]